MFQTGASEASEDTATHKNATIDRHWNKTTGYIEINCPTITDLKDWFHVRPNQPWCIGHKMTQHPGTLLFVTTHSTVLQLRQYLTTNKTTIKMTTH